MHRGLAPLLLLLLPKWSVKAPRSPSILLELTRGEEEFIVVLCHVYEHMDSLPEELDLCVSDTRLLQL